MLIHTGEMPDELYGEVECGRRSVQVTGTATEQKLTCCPVTRRMEPSLACITCRKMWSRMSSSLQQFWSSFIWSSTWKETEKHRESSDFCAPFQVLFHWKQKTDSKKLLFLHHLKILFMSYLWRAEVFNIRFARNETLADMQLSHRLHFATAFGSD